jgi:hypothetical protein
VALCVFDFGEIIMSATSGIPGFSGANPMTDPLEFVRNMWGAMKIPGMAMPSMSPDEINKQITDLKAVESWLQLNMNMLRSSIQALEIQSATLTTLQTMGQNFAQAVKPHAETVKDFTAAPEFESPFANFSSSASANKPDGAETESDASSTQAESDATAMAAQFVNPAAWWNVVQDQFSQAVGSAMTMPAKKTVRKSTRPTAAKKKAAPKSAAKSNHKTAATHVEPPKTPTRKKIVKKKSVS